MKLGLIFRFPNIPAILHCSPLQFEATQPPHTTLSVKLFQNSKTIYWSITRRRYYTLFVKRNPLTQSAISQTICFGTPSLFLHNWSARNNHRVMIEAVPMSVQNLFEKPPEVQQHQVLRLCFRLICVIIYYVRLVGDSIFYTPWTHLPITAIPQKMLDKVKKNIYIYMCTGDGWWRQRACVCFPTCMQSSSLFMHFLIPLPFGLLFQIYAKIMKKINVFPCTFITQTWNTPTIYTVTSFLGGGGLSFWQFEFFILFFTWSCYCFSLIHLFWNFNSFSPFQLFPPSFYLYYFLSYPLFCFLLLLCFFLFFLYPV